MWDVNTLKSHILWDLSEIWDLITDHRASSEIYSELLREVEVTNDIEALLILKDRVIDEKESIIESLNESQEQELLEKDYWDSV